jgi:uncharacterized protein YecT (DUF1311 family)
MTSQLMKTMVIGMLLGLAATAYGGASEISGANMEAMLDVPLFGSCISNEDICVIKCPDGGDTLSPSMCLDQQRRVAERALNDTYSNLMPLAKKFDVKLPDDLKRAQRAWLEFRRTNCQFHDNKTRTSDGYDKDRCLLVMTRQRTLEFRNLVQELSFLR